MNQEIPAKLRWACRRGMLELDVLLGKFLENAFLTLSEADQASFIALLNENDQDLFMWLLGRNHPQPIALQRIIGIIKDYAQCAH